MCPLVIKRLTASNTWCFLFLVTPHDRQLSPGYAVCHGGEIIR